VPGGEQPDDGKQVAFCVVPVLKLLLYGVVGSWPYLCYWMYRNWKAYRVADGYSRRAFWRRVRKKTGYRPSPFWRAFFNSAYCFCLFPAVDRACVLGGVRGLGAPILLATAYNMVGGITPFALQALDLPVLNLVVLVLVPVQLAINRLNAAAKVTPRFSWNGVEALFVAGGAWLQWQ